MSVFVPCCGFCVGLAVALPDEPEPEFDDEPELEPEPDEEAELPCLSDAPEPVLFDDDGFVFLPFEVSASLLLESVDFCALLSCVSDWEESLFDACSRLSCETEEAL